MKSFEKINSKSYSGLKVSSKQYVGDLYLADIGIPKEVFEKL